MRASARLKPHDLGYTPTGARYEAITVEIITYSHDGIFYGKPYIVVYFRILHAYTIIYSIHIKGFFSGNGTLQVVQLYCIVCVVLGGAGRAGTALRADIAHSPEALRELT